MICHITVTTAKLQESVEFYRWLLDLPIARKITLPDKEIVFLGKGETKLELIADSHSEPICAKGITIGFKVDNLDKKIALLKSKNISHSQIIYVPNARFVYFADLNGCNIQLFEGAA